MTEQATVIKGAASEERTRWYDRNTLQIIESVPHSSENRMIKVTLVQARKLRALPSVTSILDDVFTSGYSLQDWIIDQHINACIQFPFVPIAEQPPDYIQKYKDMIMAKANEYKEHTADRGKELHADMSRWVASGMKVIPDDPVSAKMIGHIATFFSENGVVKVESELPIGSKVLGYCGTPDLVAYTESARIILDLKTTNLANFKKPYDKWMLQLGGYRVVTKSENGTRLVQMVADREVGAVKFIDHADPDKWANAFLHLRDVWFCIKNYNPREQAE